MMRAYGVGTENDAAKMFLRRFRSGQFGQIILDDLTATDEHMSAESSAKA